MLVNYVNEAGEIRPALIVRYWDARMVNLIVFIDGTNDMADPVNDNSYMRWVTSVPRDENGSPRSWHHPVGTLTHEELKWFREQAWLPVASNS